MVDPFDRDIPVSLELSWVGVLSGVLPGILDLLGLFCSSYQSQDLSLSAWTPHVIPKGGLSTVTARRLTLRLNI